MSSSTGSGSSTVPSPKVAAWWSAVASAVLASRRLAINASWSPWARRSRRASLCRSAARSSGAASSACCRRPTHHLPSGPTFRRCPGQDLIGAAGATRRAVAPLWRGSRSSGPAACTIFLVRDSNCAGHEEPAASWRGVVHLFAGEQSVLTASSRSRLQADRRPFLAPRAAATRVRGVCCAPPYPKVALGTRRRRSEAGGRTVPLRPSGGRTNLGVLSAERVQ